jgi:hypothetical protein
LEKMCWLRRGVNWRLTCASKCLAIMVFKKNSPGHIWTTLYNTILYYTIHKKTQNNTYTLKTIHNTKITNTVTQNYKQSVNLTHKVST